MKSINADGSLFAATPWYDGVVFMMKRCAVTGLACLRDVARDRTSPWFHSDAQAAISAHVVAATRNVCRVEIFQGLELVWYGEGGQS